MKIKTKIISLFLLLSLISASLSSCVFFDVVGEISSSNQTSSSSGGATIEIGEVKNYDITVQGAVTGLELAAAKALMSAVSIKIGNGDVSGSGVIFKMSDDKSEAYILTNYHVVYDSQTGAVSNKINVYLYGMESHLYGDDTLNYAMKAEFVGGALSEDIAVLKITNNEILMRSNAVACEFADSNEVRVLEPVIAVGNAAGMGISVTSGTVNVDSEDIQLLGADDKTVVSLRVIRTDAAVNGGNSGGGFFNASGKLIGIVSAKYGAGSNMENIGFAIPSNVARYMAENIMYYCNGTELTSAYKCLLGINVQIAELYTEYDETSGILRRKEKVQVLNIVTAEDPAKNPAAYGILEEGDIINSITIDGKTYMVTRMFHVVDAMLNARLTSSVTVNVTRGSETLDLSISLAQKDMSEIE